MKFDRPPPLRPITPEDRINHNFVDLTGQRFGMLTVQGIVARSVGLRYGHNIGAAWLVRCDCGALESRRAKALNHPAKPPMCEQCSAARYEREQSRDITVGQRA